MPLNWPFTAISTYRGDETNKRPRHADFHETVGLLGRDKVLEHDDPRSSVPLDARGGGAVAPRRRPRERLGPVPRELARPVGVVDYAFHHGIEVARPPDARVVGPDGTAVAHVQFVAGAARGRAVQAHVRRILLALPRRGPERAILVLIPALVPDVPRLGPVPPNALHVLDGLREAGLGQRTFVVVVIIVGRRRWQALSDAELMRAPKPLHA